MRETKPMTLVNLKRRKRGRTKRNLRLRL